MLKNWKSNTLIPFQFPKPIQEGVIGSDVFAMTGTYPAFSLPRFHAGGVVGDEVPILAQEGEAVFTPGQMKLLGSALAEKPQVRVSVQVHNSAPNATATADVRQEPSGNVDLKIMITEVENTLSRNISRGEGLAPTLQRRYGLNPAAGSYR